MPKKKRFHLVSRKQSRKFKNSIKKNGLLFVNATLIVAVTAFVWGGHNSASSGTGSVSLLDNSNKEAQTAPLDNLSSADYAANIAIATKMSETVMVVNQADSYVAKLSQANTEESVVMKPQVVTGAAESKNDIKTYVSVEGDTVESVADRFGVSADSVKHSNGLYASKIPSGKELKIPPSNGIIYTVAEGDTVDSLATKYKADKERLVAVNDIELTGLRSGDVIFIAGGQVPITTRSQSSTSSNSAVSYGFVARYGGNGYYRGYCTWYVANVIPVPSNWGNANTWDNRAPASGWTVSRVPSVGAVAQRDGGWGGLGHVAVVGAVSEDKTMIKYSDMNGIAGFGRVGYSDWVSVSTFTSYITR